jgi:biopolymer transport protein ExbB/TolQ
MSESFPLFAHYVGKFSCYINVRRINMSEPNPYASSAAAIAPRESSDMRLRRIRLVSGIIIPVSLLAGVFGTVFGMMRAFRRLAVAENVNPSQLAGDISNALMITVISLPVAGIAFCVWMWATVTLRRIRALDPTGTPHSKSGEDSHK